MKDSGLALFETPMGLCGIAWRDGALLGLQLPERDSVTAMRRLERRFPGLVLAEPTPWVSRVIARVASMLQGEQDDLADVPLDFADLGPFEAAVYGAVRRIPPGRTLTYGELARSIGDMRQARAVGQALGRNPWPIVVPCHRVTGAGGHAGGFSASGGRATKLRLLELEGALDPEQLPLFARPGASGS